MSTPGRSRRAEFKAPPISNEASQDERRRRALEEQRRQRSLRVNAARNIDLFSAMSLGDEEDDEDDEEAEPRPREPYSGIAGFASMLPSLPSTPPPNRNGKRKASSKSPITPTTTPKARDHYKKKKNEAKYANVCMLAELLELKDDPQWAPESGMGDDVPIDSDGNVAPWAISEGRLPSDLDSGWVALAPIPKGKRCLAVSRRAGTGRDRPGIVTSTYLHSRLRGTTLLSFHSPLPADSVLDCILDENWESNGIIHVLDIIRWRGTDFADCEAEFRFWWRDARLSEIRCLPPPKSRVRDPPRFPYPFTFLPVPYHIPPIELPTFLETVIPAARSWRTIFAPAPEADTDVVDPAMQDKFGRDLASSTPDIPMALDDTSGKLVEAHLESDGLLLYVSAASYQPGETPLSCWIPVTNLTPDQPNAPIMMDVFERLIRRRVEVGM